MINNIMFGGRENNGNNSGQSIMKDTLHITPHIAAHKSSSQSSIETDVATSQEHCVANSRLTSLQTFGHVSGYRVGIPTSTIFTDSFQNSASIRNQATHIQVPTIFTLPPSKSLPQDLSSHNKLTLHETENTSSQKNLPHIHSIGSQNIENLGAPLLVPVSDRTPTYYRLADGTTISISSHHQTVLVSSQNEDHAPTNHMNSVRQTQHCGDTNSSGSSMSMTVNSASHQHSSVGGISEGHLYLLPHEMPNGSGGFLAPDHILPDKELKTPIIEDVKEENEEHKDLVRQALQAAVVHNSHKSNNGQDAIAYDYGTEDIGGSDDCLVHEDIICHSTFCSQPRVNAQELFLMNINVNQGQQPGGKLSGSVVVGSNIHEGHSGGQVVVLDSASAVDEEGNIIPPIIMSSRRRRSRLTEEAQALRREKIANRMREKRASETEDQKEKRRLREAERMRKKRAQEDEMSKEKRRREAAERARLRRAKLSNEERELERKKAAARMRLRRQNENEEQKRLRRIKAAERMRKRRSTETPEERATRKLNIALRMKVKRQKKEDKDTSDTNPSSLDPLGNVPDEEKSVIQREIINKENRELGESIGQQQQQQQQQQHGSATHLLVSSGSIADVPENLTLLHNEHQNANTHLLQGSILTAVELAHIASQAVSHQLKSGTSTPLDQKSSSSSSEKTGVTFHKSVTQDSTTVHSQVSESVFKDSDSPPHHTKALHLSSHHHHHHHLPHLLHHHSPHQEQPSHTSSTSYFIPHIAQPSHSQSQPLQLGHQ